jgi:hypothetical protein
MGTSENIMDTYEARLAALDHAWQVDTAVTIVVMACFLTFALFAIWQLPWRACERAQLEEAWRTGRVLPVPERPAVASLVGAVGRRVWAFATDAVPVAPIDR